MKVRRIVRWVSFSIRCPSGTLCYQVRCLELAPSPVTLRRERLPNTPPKHLRKFFCRAVRGRGFRASPSCNSLLARASVQVTSKRADSRVPDPGVASRKNQSLDPRHLRCVTNHHPQLSESLVVTTSPITDQTIRIERRQHGVRSAPPTHSTTRRCSIIIPNMSSPDVLTTFPVRCRDDGFKRRG